MTVVFLLWSMVQAVLAAIILLCATHRILLLARRWWWRRPRLSGASEDTDPSGEIADQGSVWPLVLVQLPVYNERFVVRRLLEAVGKMDYPRDRLQIQVLDDSEVDDATGVEVDGAVEKLRSEGFAVGVLRRRERRGFKAGALKVGLDTPVGGSFEGNDVAGLVTIFDADFVPGPDFLRRMVPLFAGPTENDVGMVQARWGYLNAQANWLTRVQAWFLDAHFRVEHAARWRAGCCFNFNGTAGVWRRRCIVEAGGWQGDTLTEDLDLSYRAQVLGWRFVYADDVVVPSELPGRWSAFRAQQFRWAKGATQTARKLLTMIWSGQSRLSLAAKAEATLHLTSQAAYLVFGALLLGGLMVAVFSTVTGNPSAAPLGLKAIGLVAMLITWAFFAATILLHGERRKLGWRDFFALLLAVPVAVALAVSNGRAVLEGWLGVNSPFERTPKVGDCEAPMPNGGTGYLASSSRSAIVVEMVLGVVFSTLAIMVIFASRWLEAFLLLPIATGFLWIGVGSMVEQWQMRVPQQGVAVGLAAGENEKKVPIAARSLRDPSENPFDVPISPV